MRTLGLALLIFLVALACALSIYTERPPDPLTVVADASAGLRGDGIGSGDPVPVIESSGGGHEILAGIGVYTGYSAPRGRRALIGLMPPGSAPTSAEAPVR